MRKWKPNAEQRKAIKQAQEAGKRKKCVACNGSGRYDVAGSPKCGACKGTGFTQPSNDKYSE